MKVKELIEQLNQIKNPDAEVVLRNRDGRYMDIAEVEDATECIAYVFLKV